MTDVAPSISTATGAEVRTFLIADVRGYTRFTLEHGDQAAARLAARFAELADAAVRARDGTVIELRGDEALAVFTSPRQALRAAVELQSRFAGEESLPIKAGIGLDAGEAIPVGAGFRGAALNLAARLCSLAGPGEILASDTVANLARKLDDLEYAERGAVQLKGFTDPVNVVQVQPSAATPNPSSAVQEQSSQGEGPATGGLPIGAYLGSLPANPLVGREVELARILSVVDGVVEGRGKLVVLAGEPGVGKTRLAQEVTLNIRNRGFVIAAGRCYEPQQTVPFYPFVDALASAYAVALPAVQAQVPKQWPDLARLLPSLGLPRTDDSGSPDKQRLHWQVTGFLQALAAEHPVALLVDDLHWADAASLDLLLHLTRHTGADRILVLCTYRDVEVNRQHPLEAALRDLQREDLVERVAIRRLERAGTAALVAATMGEEQVSEEFASLIFRRTEGNPFFVQQVMRMLVERGDVYEAGDHWERKAVEEIDVPESIRSVVGQRLSRLAEDTQELLREASVLGQTFSFDDLEAMTERSEREVEQGLEEAARAGLIREVERDRHAFDHALTQQSLYGELTTRRRRRLHQAAGEAIEGTSERKREGRAAELAWHFLEGDEPERALAWALVAGDGAAAVFAHSDAELQYRTALQLARELGNRESEVVALEKLGHTLYMLARYDEELDILLPTLLLHRAQGNLEDEMRTAAAIGWTYFEVAQRHKGIEMLTPVLERWVEAGQQLSPAAAGLHISLGNLHWGDGSSEVALPLFERGAELARLVGDDRLLGLAELRRGTQLAFLGRIDEALDAYNHAIRLAEQTNDLDVLSRTLNNRSLIHELYRNDGARGEADLERQVEVARKLGKPAQLVFALKALGNRYIVTGRWPRARELLDEAVHIVKGLGVVRGSDALGTALSLRLMTGEVEAALMELEACVETSKQVGNSDLLQSAQEGLARWDLLNHRPALARRRLEDVLDNPNVEDQARWWVQCTLAVALARTGDCEEADRMVREGLTVAHQIGLGPALILWRLAEGNVRACQERWDEARAAFDQALASCQVHGIDFPESTVLHDYGRMEGLAGNQAAARARYEEELALLRPMGASALIERVEWEISQL